ncbi:hypothetical protein [Mycobacterium sp. NPDC006124]|uniref:hypothetical protein n=1 Tax=Mycobacterium sp. NPDC006124 TaxID=3156729 RepID=UPI0033B1B8D6
MTVRDLGAEYGFDDPDDGWFGAAGPAEDTPPRPAPPPRFDHRDESEADTDRWFVRDMAPAEPVRSVETVSVATPPTVVPTRRNGFVPAAAPDSWESRISNSGAWEFKTSTPAPRRPPRAAMFAAAVLAAAAVVAGVVMLMAGPDGDEASPAPSSSSSAPPVPSSAPAVATVAPVPPPPVLPPPPPPPPPADAVPPVVTRDYTPSYQTPDTPKKPQQNVTRVPLSATPPPPPRETDRGRATPGQSGAHGFFG